MPIVTQFASSVFWVFAIRIAPDSRNCLVMVASYGGIIGVNRVVDEPTARAIEPGFFEAIVAPGYSAQALAILGAKEGFEIVEVPPEDGAASNPGEMDLKRIGMAAGVFAAIAAAVLLVTLRETPAVRGPGSPEDHPAAATPSPDQPAESLRPATSPIRPTAGPGRR